MKIAYLIVAHNHFDILEKTIRFLDSSHADFFIHVDKKYSNVNFEKIKSTSKKSQIYFVPSINIQWGGYSQIKCTLSLLEEAYKNHYDFYYLLSGVDFPIKSKKYIEDFTEKNLDKNFVDFENDKIFEQYLNRIQYYYIFQDININNYKLKKILTSLDNKLVTIQKLLHIKRISNDMLPYIQKGCNWFAINKCLVNKIIRNSNLIHHLCKYSRCADEIFLQTMVLYFNLENTIYKYRRKNNSANALHYIDWNRGTPYIFEENDVEELLNAPEDCLFARKFDSIEVIDKIVNHLS